MVFERLLARLVIVAPDAWVLKGGFALELRLGSRARSTKDVDLDWVLEDDDVGELLRQAAALELDDRFEFTGGRLPSNSTSPRSCTPTPARTRGVSPALV